MSDAVADLDVVIPTRNRPALLRNAIEAILAQNYSGPIRVLVVFDQSEPDLGLETEAGLGIVGQHRRVEVLRNNRSPGLAGARNTGLLAATAELVAFCDDDDTWLPNKLAQQVEALANDSTAEFVSCGIEVNYDGRDHSRTLSKTQITMTDLLRNRLTELHPSTFVMRRKAVLDGFGLVDETIPGSYAEDYEFLLRAARSHSIANVSEVGVRVLWSKQSYFSARWQTIRSALIWLLEQYPEFHSVPAGEARVSGQIAFASAANGDRRQALHWAGRTVRRNPLEARAYLALGVASGLVKSDTVLQHLHRTGRGI
jgi:glycosyltransferase involved in cell wall biosynthesis